jgi:hypothetical protein
MDYKSAPAENAARQHTQNLIAKEFEHRFSSLTARGGRWLVKLGRPILTEPFPTLPCRRFASLHRVLRGEFPLLRRYYQSATTPCRHPTALRFLRLAVPRLHSLLSLPGGRVHRQGLELVTRYLPAGNSPRSEQGSPKFLGNHDCPFAHVPIRRRQDCLHQTVAVQQRGP